MANNARYAAIETLTRSLRTRHPVTQVLAEVVASYPLCLPDRHLAMNIIFGVLRHRQQIDALISHLCARPPDKRQAWAYQALSAGLYQLFFLDRIPGFAAVSETVNALHDAGLSKKMCGFVNGVLRESMRQRENLEQLLTHEDLLLHRFNHPSWLTKRWEKHFGTDTMRAICLHNNREPVLCLRVSRSIGRDSFGNLLDAAGVSVAVGDLAPDALLLHDFHGPVTALPGYHEGWFQVQDQTAQLATLLLAPFGAERRYLDCCAGVGGKTTYLADLLPPVGEPVVAIEPDPGRYRLLEENLGRTGTGTMVERYQGSLDQFAATSSSCFDAILVDAPCSGTGVIGRHPDIRWNRRESDLKSYQRRQLDLLDIASGLLAVNGVLVYATCSIEPEENTAVLTKFLTKHRSFKLSDCRDYLPSSAAHLVKDSCFSPLPAPGQDGFFAARLHRDAPS